MYSVKRLEISGRKKPMWTVVDSVGSPVFQKRDERGNLCQQAWSLKKDANRVVIYIQIHGLNAAIEKFGFAEQRVTV